MAEHLDEFGNDAYNKDWLHICGRPGVFASDGTRVTSAKALQIAADVLRWQIDLADERSDEPPWTEVDIALALGAISGIRAQRGCEDLTADHVEFLTHVMDIAIYG